jgi:Contractile injection system tape measure protein
MNSTVTHSIGKLSFHLNGVNAQNAFPLRQQAAAYLQHDFLRLAEEVFDEFELDDQLLFIPQLSLKLQVAGDMLDLKKQENQLQKQIREQIKSCIHIQQLVTASALSTEEIKTDAVDADLLLKTWAFYLETGYLPAYMPLSIWRERLSWWQKLFPQFNTQLKEFFILQLRDEQRLKRFLKNETEKGKEWILHGLHPELITFLQKGREKRNQSTSLSFFESKTYLQILFSENNTSVIMQEQQLPALDVVMHQQEAGEHSSSVTREPSERKNVKPLVIGQGIIVYNAGIVLLQPFITTLFYELHLLSEDRKTIIDKHKACALLSVLAGDEEQDEIYYPLYKLLCGLPVEEVIDYHVPLTMEEREECFCLLQQVILHWPALKQSSVPSLQQTFLQRTGKLSKKEDKWLLQVEQRTEDVLMQFLPWSYSIIRYPWMKQALFTEWT